MPTGAALALGLTLILGALGFSLWRWRARALALQAGAAGALRASESHARAVVESVADGILTLNQEGRLVGYSPAAERIFGHLSAEVLGQPAEILVPALHAPKPGRHDTLAWRSSGFSLPVEIAVTEMHDGLRRGWVVVVRDTSERRSAEQALRASEERQRAVVAALGEGILVYDGEGQLEACNPSAERILGQSEAELRSSGLGQGRWRAVRADGGELPDEEFPALRCLRSGQACVDSVFGLQDGERGLRWVQSSAMPLARPGEDSTRGVVMSLRDITERRGGEMALATLNAEFHSILGAATEFAIMSTDTNGLIRVFNSGAELLLGYAPAEVVGRVTPERFHLSSELSFKESCPPQVLALWQRAGFEALVAQARQGGTETREYTYVRKDGGQVRVSLTVSAQRDAEHRVTGFLFIARDVTERHRSDLRRAAQYAATQVLAQSASPEDGLPRLLETLGSALGWECVHLFLVDREAGLLRPAAQWSVLPEGFREFEELTRSFVFPPGRGLPGGIWESGQPQWIEDLQRRPDFFRLAAAAPCGLQTAFGVPIALAGDVLGVLEFFSRRRLPPEPGLLEMLMSVGSQVAQFLERDAADRARRAADERSHSVVDSMLEGLLVADSDGRIELVNPAAERLFGYASWELVGQSLRRLLPPRAAVEEGYLNEAYARAVGQVTEWEACRKNGEVFPLELSLVEFHTAEGRRLMAGHVRDLTEPRKLERMKKEFVATVSHELRTPLTSIRGSLALLLSGALGDMPDEGKDMLEIAERNTLRLITLINDILDLERLEAGRLELHLGALALQGVVERALESVRGMADEHGVSLEAEQLNCQVRGDGDRLVQVLVNLLSNAVKFSPRGAPVRVACRVAHGQAEVRVEDRGRGIPRDRLSALFQRFQQVEASDAREKGGTGLGLAICKAIVEQHGGAIGVESELGHGSTFWFRVPLQAERAGLREDALLDALQSASGDAPDVLLVDTDPALLGVMTRQLLQQGLGTRAAQDGAEALRAVRERAPALVVLDPEVPEGRALPANLRALGLADVPILVYTTLDLNAEACRELGLGPRSRVLTKARESGGRLVDVVLELLGDPEARPAQPAERQA